MLTNEGYYRQVGSPPAPLLANGWLRKFDNAIKGDATLYSRYMDNVLRNIDKNYVDDKLKEITNYILHLNLPLNEKLTHPFLFSV